MTESCDPDRAADAGVPLRVRLIAATAFFPPQDVDWTTDADGAPADATNLGGQALAEFAGRACYQSWSKPNPATASNAGYLRHILDVGHYSVLEHGTVTFYLTGVSRSLTHELVRHRHFSYSQLSQRYVPSGDAEMVEPDIIASDPELHERFVQAVDAARDAYTDLLAGLERKLEPQRVNTYPHRPTFVVNTARRPGDTTVYGRQYCEHCGEQWPCAAVPTATSLRKQARQAARAVLPNATETRIVVTGNYRAWRHLIRMRATEHADVEIRALAVAVLKQLHTVAYNVFGDFRIRRLADGTEVAHTDIAGDAA